MQIYMLASFPVLTARFYNVQTESGDWEQGYTYMYVRTYVLYSAIIRYVLWEHEWTRAHSDKTISAYLQEDGETWLMHTTDV